jgi:hypothetical protein
MQITRRRMMNEEKQTEKIATNDERPDMVVRELEF